MWHGKWQRQRMSFRPRQHKTNNHWQNTSALTTVAGTELATTIATAVDAPTNRSTHVRAGGYLTRISVHVMEQGSSSADQKIQCVLYYLPGATSITGGAIGNYYDTTEPLIEDSIIVRKGMLVRPHTKWRDSAVNGPANFYCNWRGHKRMYDGDDVILGLLTTVITSFDIDVFMQFTTAG